MKNLPGYTIVEKDEKVRQIIKEALSTGASQQMTICEVLRFMYDTVYQMPDGELKDDLTEKLIDAMNMAKKIVSRLEHYKRTLGDKTGTRGVNLLRLPHTRTRARMRSERAL